MVTTLNPDEAERLPKEFLGYLFDGLDIVVTLVGGCGVEVG